MGEDELKSFRMLEFRWLNHYFRLRCRLSFRLFCSNKKYDFIYCFIFARIYGCKLSVQSIWSRGWMGTVARKWTLFCGQVESSEVWNWTVEKCQSGRSLEPNWAEKAMKWTARRNWTVKVCGQEVLQVLIQLTQRWTHTDTSSCPKPTRAWDFLELRTRLPL